jgi:hypothetical protein
MCPCFQDVCPYLALCHNYRNISLLRFLTLHRAWIKVVVKIKVNTSLRIIFPPRPRRPTHKSNDISPMLPPLLSIQTPPFIYNSSPPCSNNPSPLHLILPTSLCHIILRPLPTLWRCPIDILSGHLNIARLAMNAILRINLEPDP